MAENKLTCPACFGTLTAEDEAGLFAMAHEHAHEAHDMHMSQVIFRELLAVQRGMTEWEIREAMARRNR